MISALLRTASDEVPVTEPASFEQLYAAHVASVYRFCLSQVGAAAAEDVTHDTFVRAWTAYQRVRPDPGSARTWLFAIARNLSIDHHRRNGRLRRILERLRGDVPEQRGVEKLAGERTRLREIAAAMSGLDRRDRELIGLRVAAALPFRDIGEVLGLTEPAAKIATYRALRRLRDRLAGSDSNDVQNPEENT